MRRFRRALATASLTASLPVITAVAVVTGTASPADAVNPTTIGSTVDLVNSATEWRYNTTSTMSGTAWRGQTFDDSSWSRGRGEIGVGDAADGRPEFTVTTPSPPRVTSYFRTTFTVADKNEFTNLKLSVLADDGAVVYLNGVEVFRDNMPGGTISPTTYATTNKVGAAETTFQTVTLTGSTMTSNLLVGVPNSIAVEVHQSYSTSSDLSFDFRATATSDVPQPAGRTALVPAGSTWSYRNDATAAPTGWATTAFNASAWPRATAPLTQNKTLAGHTSIGATAARHTTYFRSTFLLPKPSDVGVVVIRLRVDDGAAFYLNGQEVGRDNLADGPLTFDSFAPEYRTTVAGIGKSTPYRESAWSTITVPASRLVAGTNTVGVEVHQAAETATSGWSGDLIFDVEVDAILGAEASPTFGLTSPATPKALLSDEFSGTAIDPAKWRVLDNTSCCTASEHDERYYRSQVTVGGGSLRLTAEPLATPVKKSGAAGYYTHKSGYIDQRNDASTRYFTYGYVEFRGKLPDDGNGTWPAVWLRNTAGANATYGEIDVMEHWGTDLRQYQTDTLDGDALSDHMTEGTLQIYDGSRSLAASATALNTCRASMNDRCGADRFNANPGGGGDNITDGYHVWGTRWTRPDANTVRFDYYLDGQLRGTVWNVGSTLYQRSHRGQSDAGDPIRTGPVRNPLGVVVSEPNWVAKYTTPEALIINNQMQSPDPLFRPHAADSSTPMPAVFVVDYIRVYQ